MKKRLPAFIIAGLLVVFCALAITQHPQSFYPVVEVEVTGTDKPLAFSFLFNSRNTLHNCETLTGNIARAVLKHCPQCRVKLLQCEATLNETQQAMFTDAPLTTASGRMANGVI
ncbi:MAG: hypothetical protein OEV23_01090, partial [Gallionella sp.]|nr:hypothetical protein [Gallionella sp.]